MKTPRTDAELAALSGTIPDRVISYLKEVSEEDRLDLNCTVAILEDLADLRTAIVVSDGTMTIDFGTPLRDAFAMSRVQAATWEVASEPAPGWVYLYEVVNDGGGCAVLLNYTAAWVPEALREDIEAVLAAAD